MMKDSNALPDTSQLSEAKRALFEKYLRGDIPQPVQADRAVTATPTQGHESIETCSTDGSYEHAVPLTGTDSRSPLVAVQREGSRRPFFYMHVHWEGGAFYCFTLAADLGSDQPFYVLEPYKFDGLPVPPTLEEIAEAYIESMRAIQPEGPYLLGGFCGGCLIAFEMARQLQAQGEELDLLALVEPGVTGRMLHILERHGPTFLRLTGRSIRFIGGLVRMAPDKQLDWFLRFRHLYRFLRYRDSRRLSLNPPSEVLRQDWMGIFVWSVSAYRPQPYSGKATYFWAKEETDSRRKAWDKVAHAEEAEICMIPGNHDSCRQEHVHELGLLRCPPGLLRQRYCS